MVKDEEDEDIAPGSPSARFILRTPAALRMDSDKSYSNNLSTPIFLGRPQKSGANSSSPTGNGGSGSFTISHGSLSATPNSRRISKIYFGLRPKDAEKQGKLLESEFNVSTDAIEDLKFDEYIETYFAKSRLYGLIKSPEMVWSDKPISAALHSGLGTKLSYTAVSTFKNLMCYMQDRSTKKEVNFHARLILANGIKYEKLRDEIYCQIIKQITKNPDSTSTTKGWAMLSLSTGTFRPSGTFEPYLKSYLKSNITDSNQSYLVQKYAKYALLRLNKTHGIQRTAPPSDEEIDAILVRVPVQLTVHLVNETDLIGEVESWTTAKALVKQLARQLHIRDSSNFAIYEVNIHGEERIINDEESPLDILAVWEAFSKKRQINIEEMRIVFKMFRINERISNSVPDTQLEYFQAINDVLNSRYPCSIDDHINLSAFMLQELKGDSNGTDVIANDIGDFLPIEDFEGVDVQELKKRILKQYSSLKGLARHQARVKYLEYLRANIPLYGSAYFSVTIKVSGEKNKQPLFVAINRKGLYLIEWDMSGIRETLKMADIEDCVSSDKKFVVKTSKGSKEFFTYQSEEIQKIYQAYSQVAV